MPAGAPRTRAQIAKRRRQIAAFQAQLAAPGERRHSHQTLQHVGRDDVEDPRRSLPGIALPPAQEPIDPSSSPEPIPDVPRPPFRLLDLLHRINCCKRRIEARRNRLTVHEERLYKSELSLYTLLCDLRGEDVLSGGRVLADVIRGWKPEDGDGDAPRLRAYKSRQRACRAATASLERERHLLKTLQEDVVGLADIIFDKFRRSPDIVQAVQDSQSRGYASTITSEPTIASTNPSSLFSISEASDNAKSSNVQLPDEQESFSPRPAASSSRYSQPTEYHVSEESDQQAAPFRRNGSRVDKSSNIQVPDEQESLPSRSAAPSSRHSQPTDDHVSEASAQQPAPLRRNGLPVSYLDDEGSPLSPRLAAIRTNFYNARNRLRVKRDQLWNFINKKPVIPYEGETAEEFSARYFLEVQKHTQACDVASMLYSRAAADAQQNSAVLSDTLFSRFPLHAHRNNALYIAMEAVQSKNSTDHNQVEDWVSEVDATGEFDDPNSRSPGTVSDPDSLGVKSVGFGESMSTYGGPNRAFKVRRHHRNMVEQFRHQLSEWPPADVVAEPPPEAKKDDMLAVEEDV